MSEVLTIEFEEHYLSNGLQVILHAHSRAPLVHVSLHYRVGSSYEAQGRSGFAHLFEHMMFQGSQNVGKAQHGLYVDQAGGRWNASTSKDRTNYFETLPSQYLDLALWLESDRMRSLEITPENFENQRRTVIEEKKQSYDNRPYGLSFLRFDELAYNNWAYAHPIIGSVEDLESADIEDARDFHRRFYGPGNATLVLSGDIEPAEALDRVRLYFEGIPDRTEVKVPDLSEEEQKEEKRETVKDRLAPLPAVSAGYQMGSLGSNDYYALSLLALVLAGGDSSRFYRKLVYDQNWITSLYAGPNQYRGPELFRIAFQIQDKVDSETILHTVDDELQDIAAKGVTDAELEKARNQITSRFVSRMATVSRIGELLAHYAVLYDDVNMINQELDRFHSVTNEEIQLLAAKVFTSRKRTLILTEPEVTQ